MLLTAPPGAVETSPGERLDVLFAELAELTGQRNAIDGRIVEIVAEVDRDGLWGTTGARSVAALVAWKTGSSPSTASTIAAVAHRIEEFPRCAQGMREGRLSMDQVGVIAQRAGEGSDEHYAALASVAGIAYLLSLLPILAAFMRTPAIWALTVAVLLSSEPSLALKVKLSAPL
jgi:hypothetical protein